MTGSVATRQCGRCMGSRPRPFVRTLPASVERAARFQILTIGPASAADPGRAARLRGAVKVARSGPPQRTADRPGAPDWAVGPWGIGLGTDPVRAYVEGIRVPPQETWHQENGVNVVRQAPDRADQLDMIDGLIYEIRWVLLVDNAGRRWEARPDAVPSGSGGTAGGGQTPQPAGAGWPHPPHPRRGSTSPGTPDHQDPTARSYRSMVTLAPPAPVPRRISHYQRRLRT